MTALKDAILKYNENFVANHEYEQYGTSKFPDKKLAVVSCMDTRLAELLPAAMNFKNGDIKIIKNAGAVISHPFGSVMRSLLIAVYQLKVEEIAVVGHYDCGMQGLNPEDIIDKMLKRGISLEQVEMVKNYCIDLESWLKGFDSAEKTVEATVKIIRNHPLIPKDIATYGFLIDPATGRLNPV